MKIAVIGASGLMGSQVTTEAFSRGHTVTGLCRRPEAMAETPGLTTLAVDIFDRPAFSAAVRDHDAVASCYGAGHVFDPSRNIYLETIEAIVRILDAVKADPNGRLVFVGGAGSLKNADGVAMVDQPGYPNATLALSHPAFLQWLSTLSAPAYDPTALPKGPPYVGGPDYVPALVRAKLMFEHDRSFVWSWFSPPPSMVPGQATGHYVLGGDRTPMVGGRYATITVGDAARALVDELEQRRHDWTHWTAYAPE